MRWLQHVFGDGSAAALTRLAAALLGALVPGAILPAVPAAAQNSVIHAGALVTDAEAPMRGPSSITVVDGRIAAIEAGYRAPAAGETLVDLSSLTVLPGLIDLHVHLTGDPSGDFWREAVDPDEWGVILGVKNARLTLEAGFTTVRDVGSAQETAFALRRATEAGLIAGPRVIASGPALAIVGGHGDVTGFRPEVNELLASGYSCTGPVECAEKVRLASRSGADLIKITATGGVLSQQGRGLEGHFTDAEMRSIVDTAQSLGLEVAAHAHGARGIEAAARAGVDTIEHGTYADRAAVSAMRESDSVLVPTLMAFEGIRGGLGTGMYTPVVEGKIREVLNEVGKAIAEARRQGVVVAFGTDAGVFPHGANAGEFALLMAAGMDAREALASATTVAARVLGMEGEIGRIAPGFSADMIAVSGNPIEDPRRLERVEWVMARGRAVE